MIPTKAPEPLVAVTEAAALPNVDVPVEASSADAETAVEKLQSQFGITKLDTVIANAGIGKHWDIIARTPIQEVEDHLQTNSVGPFNLYLAVISLLLASQKPRFVVISTVLGSIGLQGERQKLLLRRTQPLGLALFIEPPSRLVGVLLDLASQLVADRPGRFDLAPHAR